MKGSFRNFVDALDTSGGHILVMLALLVYSHPCDPGVQMAARAADPLAVSELIAESCAAQAKDLLARCRLSSRIGLR